MIQSITPFQDKIKTPLTKHKITILQINLGRKCNLACHHCHVEASPKRTEELSPQVGQELIELILRFPQIQTVDLTGGAPEMNYGFKPIVEAARDLEKEVIVRSNLTIFFEKEFTDLPEYFAHHQLRVVASMPCYLEDNVNQQRGTGVYQKSIQAIQKLNELGYGKEPNLILDLVYNPQIPKTEKFSLTPNQVKLELDYKKYLLENFGIVFNHLFTITNLPIGRTKNQLKNQEIYLPYLKFLESNYNKQTLSGLMCLNQLSIDYLGQVYDCDFNQMENIPATTANGEILTVSKLLELNSLDVISEIKTAAYCYGCTAGSGSSCGGALV
ncbi:arsenosugar biosynthesis radical SAM (seleno)protein ArsS [Chroococcus sp. FPU101]|uniref:arsenosugar biosynthesis radical SAM (seleno)protein ArsS n=1 Tax=Chroococcus sp. FPU101 TaxID=1974212 RepID=UPI001A8C17D4|nr:arsenosugar biosynthesis radical SAM (seleno)protein ArsS [Chroococcus sp. FPU101]GFE68589.1 Radical SAM domain protein [Chroococcus sp. FPU101]